MFYRATGEGTPIVFIHGAAGSGRLFGNQFQAFREQHRCYFLDLPGHGGSASIPASPTVEGYAAKVSEFIQGIGEPVTLVGHSMGGGVALEVALSRPELLSRLVLLGTGCRLPVAEKILAGLETDFEATLDSVLRYCFSRTVDPELLSKARYEMGKVPREVVRTDFLMCNAFDCCARLAEIGTPTLIICGEKDVMTPVSFSENLHRGIPGSRLEVIPQGSHMLMLEFPDQLNGLLRG